MTQEKDENSNDEKQEQIGRNIDAPTVIRVLGSMNSTYIPKRI